MSPPVFIVGVPRSGTTLLRRHLNAHPELHLTFEASYFGVRASQPARWSAEQRRQAWERSLSFAWQRVPVAEVRASPPDGVNCAPEHADFARLMRTCAARRGKSRWGDKSPAHVTHVGKLLDCFPDARIVHIVRDPVRVVQSLLAVPWSTRGIFGNALTVRSLHKRIAPFRDRIHELRLEDFLAEPEASLRRMLAFCELPWSDQVLDPDAHLMEDTPPLPWLRTRRADRSQIRPRPELPAVERHRVARITAGVRRRYGYPEVPRVSRGSVRAHLARALGDLREGYEALRFLGDLRRRMHTLPGPSAVELFEAVTAFHPDAALACTPEERQLLLQWLTEEAESG